MMASPSDRLPYYDNLKFLLIALVVVGHVLEVSVVKDHAMAKAAFVFIYSFHMPLFVFVSGLFVKCRKLTARKTVQRACFFIILGFAAKLILRVVPACFGEPMVFSLLSDNGLPWYMFAMAAFYTLAYVLRNVNAHVVLASSFVLALFVGHDPSIGDFLYLSRIVVFFPYFWLGTMLNAADFEAVTKRVGFRIAGAVLIVAFAVACIAFVDEIYPYRRLFSGRNSFEVLAKSIPGCSWVNRLAAYAMSVAACAGVLAVVPHMRVPFASSAGRRTLQVYLLHYPFVQLGLYTGALGYLSQLPGAGWLSVVAFALAVTFVLSARFLERPLIALGAILAKE